MHDLRSGGRSSVSMLESMALPPPQSHSLFVGTVSGDVNRANRFEFTPSELVDSGGVVHATVPDGQSLAIQVDVDRGNASRDLHFTMTVRNRDSPENILEVASCSLSSRTSWLGGRTLERSKSMVSTIPREYLLGNGTLSLLIEISARTSIVTSSSFFSNTVRTVTADFDLEAWIQQQPTLERLPDRFEIDCYSQFGEPAERGKFADWSPLGQDTALITWNNLYGIHLSCDVTPPTTLTLVRRRIKFNNWGEPYESGGDERSTWEVPAGTGTGTVTVDRWVNQKQTWEWFRNTDLGIVPRDTDYDDCLSLLFQVYRYRLYQSSQPLGSSLPDPLAEVHVAVKVPQEKLDGAKGSETWAGLASEQSRQDTLLSNLWGLVPFAGDAVGAGIDKVSWGLIVGHIRKSREAERVARACTRDEDPLYQEIHDASLVDPELDTISAGGSEELDLLQIHEMVAKLARSIDITFTRYMTAKKRKDEVASSQQKQAAEELLENLCDFMLMGHERIRSRKEEVLDLPALEDDVLQQVQDRLASGIPEDKRQQLAALGFSDERLAHLEDRLRETTKAEIVEAYDTVAETIEISSRRAFESATDQYFRALKWVREMRRLETLDDKTASAILHEYGILGMAEYREWLGNEGHFHPIGDLDCASPARQAMVEMGLTSTYLLLRKCRTPWARESLAQKLVVDEPVLLTWANVADLMRVDGIDEQHAIVLEKCRVDTVRELARRNPEHLHATLQEHAATADSDYEAPSLERVRGWVGGAKTLPWMLDY